MTSDRLRQLLVLTSFIVTVAINGAANALPLNGQTTAQISDSFRVFVIPAGYVFAIWGPIYLLQLAFVIHTLRPSRTADPLLRRLGLLPVLAAALNAAWIVSWHWNVYPVTLLVMLGLLATLIAIHLRGGFERTARPGSGLRGADRWAVQVPFSVYLGWITVATITNVAAVGAWANVPTFGIDPALIAAVVLVVGAAIATAALLATRDAAVGLVIVWAYVGIYVKEADLGTPYVPVVAAVGAAIAAALVVAALIGRGGARPVEVSRLGHQHS